MDPAHFRMSLGCLSTIPGKRRFTGGGTTPGTGEKYLPEKPYTVRASANIEDRLERSFAGQLRSAINVRGVDAILQAVWSIWGTAGSDAVRAHRERQNVTPQQLLMAVKIQEMVPAQSSGVALSRNPVTGADTVVVESVQGLGDALVIPYSDVSWTLLFARVGAVISEPGWAALA